MFASPGSRPRIVSVPRIGARSRVQGPYHVAVTANSPYVAANESNPDTAFKGDFTHGTAVEHRITGAATLTQPTTGYVYSPWAYPYYTFLYNTSGWNQGTADNVGRTAAVAHRVVLNNSGQGDVVAFNCSGVVAGTRAGSTSFLANPAITVINGDLFGATDGVYLNPGEFQLTDQGFDVAGLGWVINTNRSNATGAKNAFWVGFRSQSIGSADINAHYSASGKCDVGVDFTGIITDANKAAAALLPGDRIYLNAATSNGLYATSLGAIYVTYTSGSAAVQVIGTNLGTDNYLLWAGTKRNTSQFDKNADIALANVTGLSATVAAARTYCFRAVLFCTSAAAGGAKVAIAGTATATAIRYGAKTYTAATLNVQNQATALGGTVGANTSAVDLIEIEGLITVNAGGTLTVQFAQNAASGTSSVLVGSHFTVDDMG